MSGWLLRDRSLPRHNPTTNPDASATPVRRPFCYTVTVTSVTQPVEGVINLTPPEQLFCALIASGWSYRNASEKAGWERNYGWTKMQAPHIRDTVRMLALAAPEEAL